MTLRRVRIILEDGESVSPVAFRRGRKPTAGEIAAHGREGCIPEASGGGSVRFGTIWVCVVCGAIFVGEIR